MGTGERDWQQRVVTYADSELNKWMDSIPNHCEWYHISSIIIKLMCKPVRWDPTLVEEDFLNQSALIHSQYYLIQILVHRRFIPKFGKTSPQSFPSQAICANAARSCCHVIEAQQKRTTQPHAFQIVSLVTHAFE